MTRLLWIAEGEPAPGLRDALRDQGYVPLFAEPGERAAAAAVRLAPQALLLQGECATASLGTLRAQLPHSVLVVLLPQPAPLDEVLLLGQGADLVLDPAQGNLLLLARLRRWLQRAAAAAGALAPLRLGALEVDVRPQGVRLQGQSLPLGQREAALLQALARRNGGPASRDELARCLGTDGEGRSRWVDTAIWRLRHALQAQGVHELGIETVRGEGYRMVWRESEAA